MVMMGFRQDVNSKCVKLNNLYGQLDLEFENLDIEECQTQGKLNTIHV